MNVSDYAQLGALGIVFLFCIKEFFSYLRLKRATKNDTTEDTHLTNIFNELRLMNNNHLHTIQEVIETGNGRLIDQIHNDNTKIIEVLGRIEGGLRK